MSLKRKMDSDHYGISSNLDQLHAVFTTKENVTGI